MSNQTLSEKQAIPMDVDGDPTPPISTTVVPPLFSFPKEEPRTFTAKDLIAILSLYNAGFKKDETSGKSKIPSKAEASSCEALKILNGKGSRKRMIFRYWPRAPNGQHISPEKSLPGKSTPNGIQLWGATIFDFYRTRRFPDLASLSTITTGSKMLRFVKANGELEHAKDEIEWAEMEEEPKIIEPWSPQSEIEKIEEMIRQGKAGVSMPAKDLKGKKISTGTFSFASADYPSPWPTVPFSYETERLTSIIDLDHLPKKLIVHDPWNLLAVKSRNAFGRAQAYNGERWTSKDRTHVYKLRLSKHGKERAKKEAEARARAKEKQDALEKALDSPPEELGPVSADSALEGYMIRPPAIPGPIEPPIFVVFPPRPHPPTPVSTLGQPIEEAHLYVSPRHHSGSGNHSEVHQVEWELPRAAVIPPPSKDYAFCEYCAEADVARILREQDGEHGERKDPRWKDLSGELKIVPDGRPSVVFHLVQSEDLNKPNAKEQGQFQTEDPPYRVEYIGPVRPIRTTVEWQDPMHPTCPHIKPLPDVPPTVKMRVVAKMSIQHDQHLVKEAANYEVFERHMFEHWSGLNVLPPMHDPVPIGAMVPQFYGYYVPQEAPEDDEDIEGSEDDEDDNKTVQAHKEVGYLSPILLLEDCGSDVNPSKLTIDQKNEAMSLMYRFHFQGWAHGSVYPRNILAQPGPINVPPSERSDKTPSFRLIDFGRSYTCTDDDKKRTWSGDRCHEESSLEKLFGMGLYAGA